MEKKIKIECPIVPNYLRVEGMEEAIRISEFTEEELLEIGKEWTEELIKKSKT